VNTYERKRLQVSQPQLPADIDSPPLKPAVMVASGRVYMKQRQILEGACLVRKWLIGYW
jgi:hypothetical protein